MEDKTGAHACIFSYIDTHYDTFIHHDAHGQVKAIQEETGARVRFVSSLRSKENSASEDSGTEEDEKESKGMMIVRGTPAQCE